MESETLDVGRLRNTLGRSRIIPMSQVVSTRLFLGDYFTPSVKMVGVRPPRIPGKGQALVRSGSNPWPLPEMLVRAPQL